MTELYLDVLPLADGGARVVRVYGSAPCVELPDAVPAPDGGSWPLTELGDYCFSEKPRGLPDAAKLHRFAVADTGEVSAVPADAPCDMPAVCGSFLEQARLPEGLRVVGSCAFYNCRRVRRLSFGAAALAVGSDVFLNCFALDTLVVRAAPEAQTGLFAVVNSISEAVRAEFWPAGANEPAAALCYPAYWEDIEETPAHILLHTFSGQGYHYRQCFLNGRVLPAEYDAIFAQGHDADDAATMARLCFDRLRWPWQLTDGPRAAYREFLSANARLVLAPVLKAQDDDALRALLALNVLDVDGLAEASSLARRVENASAAALLADAERTKRAAAAPRRRRYDLDF